LAQDTETLKNKANDRECHTDWCHDYTLKNDKVTRFSGVHEHGGGRQLAGHSLTAKTFT
jgi:hypothetical protein